jgi:ABC-type bacteriocin/lantibiotic exporter with double-glycine peptidase domain
MQGMIISAFVLMAGVTGGAKPHYYYGPVDDPVVQRKRVICGPNCLYLLLRAGGIAVSYSDVENRVEFQEGGTSILALRQAAQYFGLPGIVRKCGMESLKSLRLPVIVHIRDHFKLNDVTNHFVVLQAVGENNVTVIDGTTGLVEDVTKTKFEKSWSGYVLETIREDARPVESLALQVPLSIALGLFGLWTLRGHLHRHHAQAFGLAACLALRSSCGVGAETIDNQAAAWRTSRCDAVNCVDLLGKLLDRPVPRDRIESAFRGLGHSPSLANLKATIDSFGIEMQVCKPSPEALRSMPMPMIVQLTDECDRNGGFYLLFDVTPDEFRLINCAFMARELMDVDDFRRRWSGHALAVVARQGQWRPWTLAGLCFFAAYFGFRFLSPGQMRRPLDTSPVVPEIPG